ncbi:MAG: hypothetical protein GY841_16255 [FCB group bacterium]|nr:hypothetical protein [FCB group bacterium]
MKEHFIEGIGYVYYGSELRQIYGSGICPRRGWYLRKTPDGKPGSGFSPEYLGRNRDEAGINARDRKVQMFFEG